MSSSMFKCVHCGITMSGSENYQQHLAGRRHLNALKAAGPSASDSVTSSSNTDPVVNAVKAKLPLTQVAGDHKCDVCNLVYTSKSHEEQHLSGKKHKQKVQTQQARGIKSATLYCGFCNLQVNSIEQMDQHRRGTAHNDKVDNARLLQQGKTAAVTCNTDTVLNAVKAHFLSPLPQKRVTQGHKCDICNLNYTSMTHEEEHLSGKKHKHKVWTQEATLTETLFCGLCNLQVNSMEQMDQHKSGTAHNMLVSARETQQDMPHSANDSSVTEAFDTIQDTKAAMFCGFCNLQVNSMEQMDQHRSGKTHHRKVARARLTEHGMPHSAPKKKFVPSSGTETLVCAELMPPPLPPRDLLQM